MTTVRSCPKCQSSVPWRLAWRAYLGTDIHCPGCAERLESSGVGFAPLVAIVGGLILNEMIGSVHGTGQKMGKLGLYFLVVLSLWGTISYFFVRLRSKADPADPLSLRQQP